MLNSKPIVALAAVSVLLAGCATPEYSMTPTGTSDASVTYDRGVATVASNQEHSSVKVTPIGFTPHGRIRLGVAVLNTGQTPANLGYENVTITDAAGVELHKLDRDELVRIAKRQAAMAEVAVALAGAANAYANSQSAYTTSYGNIGGVNYRATTYNPALANALNEENAAATGGSLAAINANLGNIIQNLNGSILETTTIEPGHAFGGEMIIDRPKTLNGDSKTPVHVTVTVKFAGDTHVFRFDLGTKSSD